MEIVLFINTLSSGGAEHQLSILANKLIERGYEASIVTIGNVPDHYNLHPSVRRICLTSSSSKIIKIVSIWRFFLSVKTNQVISFCQRNNFLALFPLLFRNKQQLRVICGERNCCYDKPTLYERVLFNFLYRRASFIVTNSFSQATYISQKAPHLSNKTRTIINFTDLQKYKFTILPNNPIIKICVFARYSEQKNCLRFCDAIARVVDNGMKSFQVHWYGSQKISGFYSQTFLDFQSSVKEKGLSDVLFLHQEVHDTSKLLPLFDAVCLPSLYEGFSNSIAEGISCGKPMLVSDVSDNSMMVHHGENGFLFDPTNIIAIEKAFMDFLSLDYEERLRFAQNSRKIAEDLFAGDNFINSYLGLINRT